MICPQCNEWKPLERNGMCASCSAAIRKAERMKAPEPGKPIAKMSEKMQGKLATYAKVKATFLRGKKCAATFRHDCTYKEGLTVHHMQGREGYADEWARENEVPLLIDVRFFMPLCLDAHNYVTVNSKWACENGYSFLRITDPVFRKVKAD